MQMLESLFQEVEVYESTSSVWVEFYEHVPGKKQCFMNWSLKTPVNILQIKDEDSTVLTKDLLRYKTNRGTILPKFIDPKSGINLEVARGLVNAFSANVGSIRETLEGISKQVIQAYPSNAVVGRGLEKLLMDRTEFDTEINNDLIELREKVFKNSAYLPKQISRICENLFSELNQIIVNFSIKFSTIHQKLF